MLTQVGSSAGQVVSNSATRGNQLSFGGFVTYVVLCFNPVYVSLQWPSLVCIFAPCPTWQALAFVGLIGVLSSGPCGLWCLWSAVESRSRD